MASTELLKEIQDIIDEAEAREDYFTASVLREALKIAKEVDRLEDVIAGISTLEPQMTPTALGWLPQYRCSNLDEVRVLLRDPDEKSILIAIAPGMDLSIQATNRHYACYEKYAWEVECAVLDVERGSLVISCINPALQGYFDGHSIYSYVPMSMLDQFFLLY